MSRPSRRWILLLAVVLVACDADAPSPDTYEATVSAGDVDRDAVLVSATVDRPSRVEEGAICVSKDDQEQAGQFELLNEETGRIWWRATVAAGETATYVLHLGRDCADRSFAWGNTEEYTTPLLLEKTPRLEYVHPEFDPDDLERTKKPFHHVYSPDGEQRLTKGPGGLYSHHRGLFFGYGEIAVDGDTLNTWYANDGEHQAHRETLRRAEGPLVGGHTTVIEWRDRDGEPFIEEHRTVRVLAAGEEHVFVDFESEVHSLEGTVQLDGDRQHAGVQFRAAQYVAEHEEQTRYLRPAEWADLPPDEEYNGDDYVDLPWNAIQFRIEERPYTVAYLSDPANPDGARFSERLYGRFGEFFPYELTEEAPLTVRYRFWITGREDVSREEVQRHYENFAHPPEVRLQQE